MRIASRVFEQRIVCIGERDGPAVARRRVRESGRDSHAARAPQQEERSWGFPLRGSGGRR